MISITAADVRELRNKTSAPMMDCKAALLESNGDMKEAVDWLRVKGVSVADKKSERDADQGLITVHSMTSVGVKLAGMVEVKCETDFVAKNVSFQEFVSDNIQRYMNYDEINDSGITDLIAKMGENIKLGRRAIVQGDVVSTYIHSQVAPNMGSIGVILSLTGTPSEELSKLGTDIAMHIAASDPKAIDESSLSDEWLENERKIFTDQAAETGKPAPIIEKIVDGKIKKIIRDSTLIHQPFVKDADRTVGEVLSDNDASIEKFYRFSISDAAIF